MGEVYRAADLVLGRQVAVKVALPVSGPLAGSDRFLREARATARVRDPRVVMAYDYGRDGDCSYLAMELVSGRTVNDELKRCGPFPAERAEYVVRQAAAGLAAAHRLGVVHRDIKPDNLLLTDDGSVKVADFGIVRIVNEATTILTSTRKIVGTSLYLAPERILGEPAEPASDVYALGCVLYQLVTGYPPFLADEPTAVMRQHVEREPELPCGVPADLESLILWMVAKDPADRPTADQVATGAVAAETMVLNVRRTTPKPVLAGAVATIALAVCAATAILLALRGADLPATTDMSPRTAPSAAPRSTTQSTPTPVPTATATRAATRSHPPATTKPPRTTDVPHDRGTHGKSKPGKGKKHHP